MRGWMAASSPAGSLVSTVHVSMISPSSVVDDAQSPAIAKGAPPSTVTMCGVLVLPTAFHSQKPSARTRHRLFRNAARKVGFVAIDSERALKSGGPPSWPFFHDGTRPHRTAARRRVPPPPARTIAMRSVGAMLRRGTKVGASTSSSRWSLASTANGTVSFARPHILRVYRHEDGEAHPLSQSRRRSSRSVVRRVEADPRRRRRHRNDGELTDACHCAAVAFVRVEPLPSA